ncbi:MAG TPA: phosphatase PAP2 family protein [Ignavibacteria bacterium]
MKTKELLKSDLKHIRDAFIKVYPMAFRKMLDKWGITILSIIAIAFAFYLDEAVRTVITGINNNIADTLFTFGRWYGGGMPTFYLFLGLYIIGLIFQKFKLRETGLLIGETYVFSGLITLIFKSAVGRWRPYTNKGDLVFNGWSWTNDQQFSYYSGHAAVAFALSTVLASMTDNKYLKAFYYLMAVITCISRIYHNMHWFSDVLTGALVSFLITKVLISIHEAPVDNVPG